MDQQFRAITSGLALGALAVFALAEDCYFPKKTGCGSGDDFCTPGSTVCEQTWTKTVDTGCGYLGPLGDLEPAHCGDQETVVIQDCDESNPSGFEPVGCADQGHCCYTDGYDNWDINPHVLIRKPVGSTNCCEITSGS